VKSGQTRKAAAALLSAAGGRCAIQHRHGGAFATAKNRLWREAWPCCRRQARRIFARAATERTWSVFRHAREISASSAGWS